MSENNQFQSVTFSEESNNATAKSAHNQTSLTDLSSINRRFNDLNSNITTSNAQFINNNTNKERGYDKEKDNDEEDEENNLESTIAHSSSSQKKRLNKSIHFLTMCFSSLGCIYGDIGTSPLYVFNTIITDVHGDTSEREIFGIVSCIFWIFTLIVIFKYCLIVLIIGPNNGEGGQVAIYAKIARTLKIGPRGVMIPGDETTVEDLLALTRSETSDSFIKRNINKISKDSIFVKKVLSSFILIACFFGCSLVMSDGLLTPTTSVLSSIEGIAVAVPSLHDKTMPISVGVLIALFIAQRFGSAKISFIFAPVIFVWLICLFVVGVINITYHPSIMKSFNPKYAFDFLVHSKSVNPLGPVMLCLTGAEAMFADIGHVGKKPIQYTLGLFVYPCLMITYFGQGAFIIENPSLYSNVFYSSMPGGIGSGFYWFMFVLATLATIIASQALILGVFSILKQLILLDCFPQLKIIQTSKNYSGQVYIPIANWILMVGVALTTVGFRTSARVTSAYGFGISLDFIVTTLLIAICMVYVYEMKFYYPLVFLLVFGTLDGALIAANGSKIVHGAWFPLLITILMTLFISYWRWCRSLEVNREYQTRVRINDLFTNLNLKPNLKTVDLKLNKYSSTVAINGDDSSITPSIKRPTTYNNDGNNNREIDDLDSLEDIEICSNSNNLSHMIEKELFIHMPFSGEQKVSRYDGVAIMYTNIMHTLNSPNTVPYILKSLLTSFPALPKVLIFLCVRISPAPFVSEESRALIQPMKVLGFYRCVLKFGFMDRLEVSESLIQEILSQISNLNNGSKSTNMIIDKTVTKSSKILHIFERNTIYSRNFRSSRKWVNNSLVPVNLAKNFLIEQVYYQIRSLCSGSEELISNIHTDRQNINQEIIFFGNKVEI